MSATSPAVPQFIVIPRTGIQICRRVPLRHLDLIPDHEKEAIWNAAQKIGVTPLGAPEAGRLAAMIRSKTKGAAANIRLPLVAKYACCDDIETTGWLACDEQNAVFYRLVRIGTGYYADFFVDTQSGGGSMVTNQIWCRVSTGSALLKRDKDVANIYVEDYSRPRNIVGTLIIDYGNSGCAAIFCPDDAAPGSARAMPLPTPFDVPDVDAKAPGAQRSILKSTMFVLYAPESDLEPPWLAYSERAETLIGTEDPLITSLYAPKKYVREWPEHLKSLEPTTHFRGIIGQRDGLFRKQMFVQHGMDQLLELVLASLTNQNRSSLTPDCYPQVRKLLLTYPLTWRETEKKLFRKMFADAAARIFSHDEAVRQQFAVELVCSEPVAVGTYALWEHLYYYFSYGAANLQTPSLASTSLGNLTGEPRVRMLIVDIGGGSTDIALLNAHWDVVTPDNSPPHVEVTFQQTEWARFNRAGDRISHLLATAIYEYLRAKFQITETLDFEVPAVNPGFTRERKRATVSTIMSLAERAKASMVATGQPWRLSPDDEEVLRTALGAAITTPENPQPEAQSALEFSMPVLKKWVELDRRSKRTNGEPGFMDIFVYLQELGTQCREQGQEINLVILSGRTSRLPFIKDFTAEALGLPWHRIRTVGDLLAEGLKTADHADMDKLSVVYGGHLFRNGGPIRFTFSEPSQAGQFHRHLGVVTDTPGGSRLGMVFVSPGDPAPRTVTIKVPANQSVRLGQAFRADGAVEAIGQLHNSTSEAKEVDVDLVADFQVQMKRTKKSEGVAYTEWVSGGATDIRDNFNDTGRIDCEPEGFIRDIVLSNSEAWITE